MILSVIRIVLENNWLPWQQFNVIKNGKMSEKQIILYLNKYGGSTIVCYEYCYAKTSIQKHATLALVYITSAIRSQLLNQLQVVVNIFSTKLTSLGASKSTFSLAHHEVLLVPGQWTSVSVEHWPLNILVHVLTYRQFSHYEQGKQDSLHQMLTIRATYCNPF